MTYDKELEFAKQLALDIGEIMLEWFYMGTTAEWKSDNTPITEADKASSELSMRRIQAVFPGDAVLGEEDQTETKAARTWVIDDVDGSLPFKNGVPTSTVSIALTIDGKPVVGVVYHPFMKNLYSAQLGSGAFCNERPIHVSDSTLHHGLVELADIPVHSGLEILDIHGDFYDEIVALGAKATAMWSCILPGALTAAGLYTAVVFNREKPMDGAALKVIVEEAGGKVTDLFGNEQRYDQPIKGFVASNGVVHDELLALLKTKSPVA